MIGKKLRELRERAGLTQDALAAEAGLSRIYIAEMEAGTKSNPSLNVLAKLAKALGVDIADLIR